MRIVKLNLYWIGLAGIMLLGGCASPPKSQVRLNRNADPVQELSLVEQEQNELKRNDAELLATDSMRKAEKALQTAQREHLKGRPTSELIPQIETARAWNQDVFAALGLARPALSGVLELRHNAEIAGASKALSSRWERLESDLQKTSRELGRGNTHMAEPRIDDLKRGYLEIESEAAAKTRLAGVEQDLQAAKKEGARHWAPRTLKQTELQLDLSRRAIEGSPRNAEVTRQAAADAQKMVNRLVQVTRQVRLESDVSSEDSVLAEINREDRSQQSSSQNRNSSDVSGRSLNPSRLSAERRAAALESVVAANENALENQREATATLSQDRQITVKKELSTADLTPQAREVQRYFKSNEAEVKVQAPFILVRLNGLRFQGVETRLSPAQYPLLEKLKEAIVDIGARRVVVEGHSDRNDSADENLVLSMQRADAVKNYLLINDELGVEEITAMGYGADRPLDPGDSPQAHVRNRRMDILIEPE